jgi:hypothetical protein
MLISSHVYWTWRATRGRPGARWAVLGAAAPDLPAVGAGAFLLGRGVPRAELLAAVYHRRGRAALHMGAHSLLAPAALAPALGRRCAPVRRLAAGWLAHVLVDYATHARDAWPPLWPLSRRRFASPVSYWEPERHARAFSVCETAALAVAAARDSGSERLAGLAAAAAACGPAAAALAARPSVWSAFGARPDVDARGRDLGER